MQTVSRARYLRGSARKMRQVLDLIRGRNVEEALNLLRFTHRKSALMLEKVVRSAVANALNYTVTKFMILTVLKLLRQHAMKARC